MAIVQFLDNLAIASQTWGQRRNDVVNTSVFGSQSELIL